MSEKKAKSKIEIEPAKTKKKPKSGSFLGTSRQTIVVNPEPKAEATLEDQDELQESLQEDLQEDVQDDMQEEIQHNLPVISVEDENSGRGSAASMEMDDPGLAIAPIDHGTHQELLKQYIREVARYPLLTLEEELKLATQLKDTGDIDAARRLVRANLRLVVKIAMEYRSAYQNVLDLIQEGNIGLMKAVSKFDPVKGAKLSYYASWWIRSYILKYILDNFRLVRVGTTQAQKKLFFHLMREKEKLEAQGLDAGPKLLAEKLDVREQDVVEMEQRLSGRGAEMSLNTPVGGDEDGKSTYMDMIADRVDSPDNLIAENELQSILKSRMAEFAKTLKEKELAIFQERLAAEEPKTLQEVADQFGLTRERARQIEAKVIEKLREYYKKYIR